MRPLLLAAAAALLQPGATAGTEVASGEANRSCLDCHAAAKPGEPGVSPADFGRSVHGELACTDCHSGYEVPGPHELAPLPAAEAARVAPYRQALRPRRGGDGRVAAPPPGGALEMQPVSSAPPAWLACEGCHSEAAEAVRASAHGRWLAERRPVAGPTCADCHGDPHAIARSAAPGSPEARARSRRCEGCHDDPRFTEAAGLKAGVGVSYRDSIHGRLVAVGSQRAPACADCHGAHAVRPKDDPASPVAAPNKARTCARCHEGASDTFAAAVSHRPLFVSESPVPHFLHVMFSWLTVLVMLFFAFHVLVDLVYELRQRLARRGHSPGPEAEVMVVRFDIHQRIQHWLMLTGVILLGITGWPLRGAGSPEAIESSRKFLAVFGGPHGAGLVHRIAAVMTIVAGAYHLAYLGFLAGRKRLPLSMLPTLRDVLDMRDNILFMLGLRRERPPYGRYSYLEKFDYWAVFWGMVIMVGTGLVFWFPVAFARWTPHWMLTASQIVHGEEATLAILFLFCVHFYNVHLKPSIFPMSWVWLNGKISLESMREEHPLEYRETRKGPG